MERGNFTNSQIRSTGIIIVSILLLLGGIFIPFDSRSKNSFFENFLGAMPDNSIPADSTQTELRVISSRWKSLDEQNAFIQASLQEVDPSLSFVGYARTTDVTPQATDKNAYLAVEAGTIFGKQVRELQFLVAKGTDFDVVTIDKVMNSVLIYPASLQTQTVNQSLVYNSSSSGLVTGQGSGTGMLVSVASGQSGDSLLVEQNQNGGYSVSSSGTTALLSAEFEKKDSLTGAYDQLTVLNQGGGNNLKVINEEVPVVEPVSVPDTASAKVTPQQVTYYYEETDEAFANPMKGFRPVFDSKVSIDAFYNFVTIYKKFFYYNDLEPDSAYGVQRIIDKTNIALAGIENKNAKVIPRVSMSTPTKEFWPTDISQPSYGGRWYTEELRNRLVKMIYKLGEAWDNDPRIAFVELGLWGYWGEQHCYPDGSEYSIGSRIPQDFQDAMGKAANEAFKNKKVMIRYQFLWPNFNFGCFWDSFALPNDLKSYNAIVAKNNWDSEVNLGEISYTWGDVSLLGTNINGTIANTGFTDNVISCIESTHTSVLGYNMSTSSTSSDQVSFGNAKRLQKALGYRFVIHSATFDQVWVSGESSKLTFNVENVGSAPFYYNWPVQLSLLDRDHNVVHRYILPVDIRTWEPGRSIDVNVDLNIDENVPAGTYTVALCVVDPAGNLPSLRFANKNYFTGGWTPLGKIGVGVSPDNEVLDSFDLLLPDKTLKYIVK